MKILIVTPAPPGSRKGNRVTALRWARVLRELGHHVAIMQSYRRQAGDVLVALHARRSFASIRRFRKTYPGRPIVVAMTGTDLYEDIHRSANARTVLQWASRLIVLQPLGVRQLPRRLRGKARVIYQSVGPIAAGRPRRDRYDVVALGHLRPVKDPFRAALAARRLPAESRIRVLQVGAALSKNMADRAIAEMRVNRRYTWLGERPRGAALRILARCRLLVVTSRLEGGANVVSEAVVADVPVLSSRIDGTVGLLGADYPGYFAVGNTAALASLLWRAETDRAFYSELKRRCGETKPLFEPAAEGERWRLLLAELV